MMAEFPFLVLEGDSEDLTDIEVASAIQTTQQDDLVQNLRGAVCPHCGSQVRPSGHSLRRRKGRLFWRVDLTCGSHASARVFEADWWRQGA
jgi:DNA-directed RNA polymerase subunit RPC12/RpoP